MHQRARRSGRQGYSRIRRGAASIALGSAAGQIVAVATAPVLTRLYTPADFGLFSVFAAVVVTLATVSALRFDLAVPLPEDESQAHSLVALGLWSALGFAVVGSLFMWFFSDTVGGVLGNTDLKRWLWMAPLAGSVLACLLLLNQLAVRHRRYGGIARRNFLGSSSMVFAQIVSGVSGFRPGGLMLGLTFGHLVGAVSLLPGAGLRSPEARAGRRIDAMRSTLRRYRRFPLFLSGAGLINVAGQQVLVVLVAAWYGSQAAGWLGLTQRVLALPVTLVGTAIAQVYLGELAEAVRHDLGRALSLFRRASRFLAGVAILLMAILLVAAPHVFAVAFGPEWRMSGEYARALSLGLAAQLVASPLSQTLIALERQGLQLAWDVARLGSMVAAVATAVALGASALTAIWVASGVSVALYGVSWWLSAATLRIEPVAREESVMLRSEQELMHGPLPDRSQGGLHEDR